MHDETEEVAVPNARILIVEDHPTMREAMRLVLEGEGFSIGEAGDGQRALEMVRADPPDLVFLDMHMPGSSGAEVLAEVRADPATAGVRVIIVTADGEEGRERAMAMGADEYFTKPFSPITLLDTVERVLNAPPHESEA
ncbi:MAG: response regulator [Actinomycetota bacterium]|nr:response regulator [Actinomycetota bacterium]